MAKYQIFFGTYSKGPGNGVFSGEFDAATGKISLGKTVDIENPSYLQLDNNILYGVSEINDGALFAIDTVEMKGIKRLETHGKHPCHLWLKDNFIFASNYSEGSLSIFRMIGNGMIAESLHSIHHFGKSINEGRQKQSHVHFAAITPDDKYLAVCDLGMDKVFLYPYAKETGISTNFKTIICPPGAGPRHLTFSKCGEYMYVLTELTNTVLVYNYKSLEFLQEISTLPADFTARSTCAAIHISPDGTLLAASNRGHDSLAIFKIKENGELDFSMHVMNVKEPRDFRFSPDGNWLLVGQQNGDCVTVFKIENDTFTQTSSISLPKPVCILFGGEI